jgi:GNAT superfamily N-acetyltransferase
MKNSLKHRVPSNPAGEFQKITQFPDNQKEWDEIALSYATTGTAGITWTKTFYFQKPQLESLTFRNHQGQLLGIMDYFMKDTPDGKAKRGDVIIIVKPGYRGRGIGMELLKEAMEIWNLDLKQQKYTPLGFQLLEAYMKQKDSL